MDDDLQRLANLLGDILEKYADRIDLDSLPDPPRPTTNNVVGLLFFGCSI